MSTEHLSLTDGTLWLDGYAGPEETYHLRPLGSLADPTWPKDLGAEPEWFDLEVRELAQQFADARAFGRACVATAEISYLNAIGAL